jgi:ankyrin repeat protein
MPTSRTLIVCCAAALALLPGAIARAAASDPRLVTAVKGGDHETLRTTLKRPGVDANVREVDGTTPLHWAARGDDGEAVRLLLKAGARADVVNRYGVTPIGLAAANGNAAIVDALIVAGADPNTTPPAGEPVLMTAARAGSVDTVNCLIDRGADVNAHERWLGETALMWAAAGNHADVAKALIQHGAEVDARSHPADFPRRQTGLVVLPRGSWTAVMYAARQGAEDAARVLSEAGANLNLTDPDGTTALVLAIINAHYDTAKVLVEKGADPNIADTTGMGALYAAADMSTLPWMFGRNAPNTADNTTCLEIMTLLLDRGANPNAKLTSVLMQRTHTTGDTALGEGSTPFMRAAKAADLPVMKLLIERGGDPLATEKNHTTAMMLLAGQGWRDGNAAIPTRDRGTVEDAITAIGMLLDKGADVNAVNDAGDTAMHAAAFRGSTNIIKFLLSKQANLRAKNKQGRTPLDTALSRRGASAVPAAVALLQELTGEKGTPPAGPAPAAE